MTCTERTVKQIQNLRGGVAFKLIMALEGEYCDTTTLLDNYSDLLSIGTIGDVVELKDETEYLSNTDLKALQIPIVPDCRRLSKFRSTGKTVSSTNVSFTIVPRINAVGRLGLSEKSVSLLLTEDYDERLKFHRSSVLTTPKGKRLSVIFLKKLTEIIRRKPIRFVK